VSVAWRGAASREHGQPTVKKKRRRQHKESERRFLIINSEAQLKLAAADGDFSDDELGNLQGGHLPGR
jgi:hypothetical protein